MYDSRLLITNHYLRWVDDRCISATAPAAIAANFAAWPHDTPAPRLAWHVVVAFEENDAPPRAASATFCAVFLASLNSRSLVSVAVGTDSPLEIAASRSFNRC
jgi:hypothetical protein